MKAGMNRMNGMKKLNVLAAFVATLVLQFAVNAKAESPQFSNLSQDDFNDVVRELSANGMHHSVTPPSSMGQILGFEIGVIGGVTETPDIDRLVVRSGSPDGMSKFPHAGLLGVLSTPLGYTAEIVFVPKLKAQGVSYDTMSAALKWVPTDKALPLLPVNIALRVFYSQTNVSYAQTVTDADTSIQADGNIDFKGKAMGAQLLVSPKLIPIFEPYLGIGTVKADGRMNIKSTSSFFNFTDEQSAKSSPTSTQLLAGLDIRLLVLGLGVEYSKAFETESLTAKLSFKF